MTNRYPHRVQNLIRRTRWWTHAAQYTVLVWLFLIGGVVVRFAVHLAGVEPGQPLLPLPLQHALTAGLLAESQLAARGLVALLLLSIASGWLPARLRRGYDRVVAVGSGAVAAASLTATAIVLYTQVHLGRVVDAFALGVERRSLSLLGSIELAAIALLVLLPMAAALAALAERSGRVVRRLDRVLPWPLASAAMLLLTLAPWARLSGASTLAPQAEYFAANGAVTVASAWRNWRNSNAELTWNALSSSARRALVADVAAHLGSTDGGQSPPRVWQRQPATSSPERGRRATAADVIVVYVAGLQTQALAADPALAAAMATWRSEARWNNDEFVCETGFADGDLSRLILGLPWHPTRLGLAHGDGTALSALLDRIAFELPVPTALAAHMAARGYRTSFLSRRTSRSEALATMARAQGFADVPEPYDVAQRLGLLGAGSATMPAAATAVVMGTRSIPFTEQDLIAELRRSLHAAPEPLFAVLAIGASGRVLADLHAALTRGAATRNPTVFLVGGCGMRGGGPGSRDQPGVATAVPFLLWQAGVRGDGAPGDAPSGVPASIKDVPATVLNLASGAEPYLALGNDMLDPGADHVGIDAEGHVFDAAGAVGSIGRRRCWRRVGSAAQPGWQMAPCTDDRYARAQLPLALRLAAETVLASGALDLAPIGD